MTTVAELPAGFADKVLSAQSTFRSVMDAMARPGSVQCIAAVAAAPAPMMHGTAAIALTLFDHDKARMIALCDALIQTSDHADAVEAQVLAPLRAHMMSERERRAAETAATRVDFYTLVRGEG